MLSDQRRILADKFDGKIDPRRACYVCQACVQQPDEPIKKALLAFSVGGSSTTIFAEKTIDGWHPGEVESAAKNYGVVESFRLSIINKDRQQIVMLLAKPDISWISVVDGGYMAHRAQDYPDHNVIRAPLEGNPIKFIEGIASHSSPPEERFQSVKIDTCRNMANVVFDYSFYANGVKVTGVMRGPVATQWPQWQLQGTGTKQ